MFHSVSLFSQAPLARGSRALASVLSCFCDAISYGLVWLRAPEFTLRDEQKKAIMAVYEGKGHLVSLPTVGKGIYLQILPLCLITKVVVVSPLIALF